MAELGLFTATKPTIAPVRSILFIAFLGKNSCHCLFLRIPFRTDLGRRLEGAACLGLTSSLTLHGHEQRAEL
jgi:hypothetical protein